MKITQVAAQLYTVRDFLKTPEEISVSLKKIKAIGYDSVQISGLGPIPDDDLTRLLEENSLVCCVTHEPGDMILNDPEKIIKRLKKLKCSYTGYPHPGKTPLETLDDVLRLAKGLNHSGKIFHNAGITLVYHNHHIEFRQVAGKTILEILFEETDPRFLQALIDTYWVQYGGGGPAAWCSKLRGRVPLIHLKDYVINKENAIAFAEVGSGNLDWNAIISAAEDSGCKWFIVEQDVCSGDPFDSLRKSYDYIRENLACI